MGAFKTTHGLFLVVLLSFLPSSTPSEMEPCTPWLRSFTLDCNGTLTPSQMLLVQSGWTTVLLPILYLMAMVVGLPSNLLALWVLIFRTKRQASTMLLINLTICDLLLLIVLPFRTAYHLQGNDWLMGEATCRVVMALFYGNMYGSVLFLALIAFDRYLALVHPIGGRMFRGRRTSACMSVAAWFVVLIAMGPLLATQQTYKLNDPDIMTCHDALPNEQQLRIFLPYFASLFALCFLVPLLTVVFCYGSILHTLVAAGKRYGHAVRVTVLVLLVFLVCVLPSNALLLAHSAALLDNRNGDGGRATEGALYVAYMVTLALSAFNSCLDPFIFYYVSEDFREKARQVLCCESPTKWGWKRKGKGSAWIGGSGGTSTLLQDTRSSLTSSSSRSKVTLLSSSVRVTEATPEASIPNDAS